MNLRSQIICACVGSVLLTLPTQFFPFPSSAQNVDSRGLTSQLSSQFSDEQIHQIAQSITVKVFSGRSGGSGIAIHKQGQIYTVVTNQHVLTAGRGSGYQIQTSNGLIYPAEVVNTVSFEGNDLALLQFRSADIHAIASLGRLATLKEGDEVFAAGFPVESEQPGSSGFILTTGTISLVSPQAIAGGYQIGYTNPVEKGMSGGPILNRQGQVIGINGMHAYPLWGDPYVFLDGSPPPHAMRDIMRRSSMGIAIDTFLQLASGFSNPIEMPAAIAPPSPIRLTSPGEQPQDSMPESAPHQGNSSVLPHIQETPTVSNSESELLW